MVFSGLERTAGGADCVASNLLDRPARSFSAMEFVSRKERNKRSAPKLLLMFKPGNHRKIPGRANRLGRSAPNDREQFTVRLRLH